MKVKFSQFIFAFLICYSFCSFAFTQGKPVALKFDELMILAKTHFIQIMKNSAFGSVSNAFLNSWKRNVAQRFM